MRFCAALYKVLIWSMWKCSFGQAFVKAAYSLLNSCSQGREALCLKFWDCSYDTRCASLSASSDGLLTHTKYIVFGNPLRRSLAHFVRFAADAMNHQYFVHYINMLAALSSGARPATQV